MLLLLPAALASVPYFVDSGIVLDAPSDGTWPWGIGAPSVEWDGTRYVMYFESDVGPAAGCPTQFVIGRATSPDGIDWTIDAAPVLTRDAADARSHWYCGVSQPAVAYDGTTWHLAFMENEYTNEPRAASKANYLGYAQSTDGITFSVVEDEVGTRWRGRSGSGVDYWPTGFPSVVVAEGEVNILYTTPAGLGYARSADDDGLATTHYALETELALGSRWVYSPSTVCDTDPATVFRTMFLYGYGGYPPEARWTENEAMWLDTTELTIVDTEGVGQFEAVRHVELLRVGDDDAVLWYTALDDEGRRVVGYAATTSAPGVPRSRSCDVDFAEGEDFPNDVDAPNDYADYWPSTGSAEYERGDTAFPDTAPPDTALPDTGDTGGDTETGGESAEDSGEDSGDDSDTNGDTATDSAADSGDDSDTDSPIREDDAKSGGCGAAGGCASAGTGTSAGLLLGVATLMLRRSESRRRSPKAGRRRSA